MDITQREKDIEELINKLEILEDEANDNYRLCKTTYRTERSMDYYDGLEEGYRSAKYMLMELLNKGKEGV